MIRTTIAGAAILGIAGTASAAPATYFSAFGTLTGGYSSNPFLEDDPRGSATLGLTIDPQLQIASATGTTTIAGDFSRVEYLGHSEHSRSYSASLSQVQQLSTTLSANGSATYIDSTSALLQPFEADAPPDVDILSSRQRVRTVSLGGGLNWQPSTVDTFGVNGSYSHSSYPGSGDLYSSYTSYGATGSYSHTFSERTSVGASLGVTRTTSKLYPDATIYQPNLTLKQRINAYWTLDGSVGVIIQDSVFAGHHDRSTSLGFNADLCGTYPRLTLCFLASRNTSASGYGGVRTQTSISTNGTYTLDEHSRVSGNAGYTKDVSDGEFGPPSLSYAQASATYDRDLSKTLGIIATAGYQRRMYHQLGTADGVSASLGLRVKLGRTR